MEVEQKRKIFFARLECINNNYSGQKGKREGTTKREKRNNATHHRSGKEEGKLKGDESEVGDVGVMGQKEDRLTDHGQKEKKEKKEEKEKKEKKERKEKKEKEAKAKGKHVDEGKNRKEMGDKKRKADKLEGEKMGSKHSQHGENEAHMAKKHKTTSQDEPYMGAIMRTNKEQFVKMQNIQLSTTSVVTIPLHLSPAEQVRAAREAILRRGHQPHLVSGQLLQLAHRPWLRTCVSGKDAQELHKEVEHLLCAITDRADLLSVLDACEAIDALVGMNAGSVVVRQVLGNTRFSVLQAISGHVMNNKGLSGPQAARLVWALAKMGFRTAPIFKSLASYVLQTPEGLTDSDISMCLWGVSKAHVADPALLERFCAHLMSGPLTCMGAHELATVAWVFAAASKDKKGEDGKKRYGILFAGLAQRAVEPAVLCTFTAQGAAKIVWGFAKLGIHDRQLMAGIADCILQLSHTVLNPYQIAITAWAFATLGVYHDRLMAGLTLQALKPQVLGLFEPRNLANTIWSLATLNIQDQPVLVTKIAERLTCIKTLAAFEEQELATVAWALAVLNSHADAALHAILTTFHALTNASVLSVAQVHQLHIHVLQQRQMLPRTYALLQDRYVWLMQGTAVYVEQAIKKSTKGAQSRFQRDIRHVLKSLKVHFREEVVLSDAGGYSVDFLLTGKRMVLEVDGPFHFLHSEGQTRAESTRVNGPTVIKRRQLESFGYQVRSVGLFEWEQLRGKPARAKHLSQLLGLDMAQEYTQR
uniref:RAP domain-containing protein n=1 Tax=Eutreptiella gymnastica TaxID=73025 RepID=A0A7S1N485_9EUGL|mmetsp:Transcript_114329/g.198801  ORF Transcript_114329/g.198801 Transcript_114329/m.198801 type:complete len:758 (+) Transcript_114329:79-2352(+)